MRVLIVDDEPLARRRLARLLAALPALEVVGEAGDTQAARRLIRERQPELVLLDIDMPGEDGVSLARELAAQVAVVFTTAHRKHAVDAFAVAAVDYLLKPIEEERLREAIERARKTQQRAPRAELGAVVESVSSVESAVRDMLRGRATPMRLAARAGDAIELLDPAVVSRLYASDKYTLCRVAQRELVLDESLNVLEGRLAGHGFLRVHRSELINLHRVRALRTELEGTFVELDDGQRAQVSRRSLAELKQRLGIT